MISNATDMKKNPFALVFVIGWLLLLQACGAPSTNNEREPQGEHITDTTAQPGPGDSQGQRPWSESENLLDPNGFDQIQSPLAELGLPINAAFAKAKHLEKVEIRSYADSDNTNLQSGDAESSLSISRSQTISLDQNGRMASLLDEKFLGAGDPVTSKKATWTWEDDGKSGLIDFEDKVGNKLTKHNLAFGLDDGNRIIEADDRSLLSVIQWKDDAKGHRYLAYQLPRSKAQVYVIGKQGAWNDFELAVDISDDILREFSEIVDYKAIGGPPSEAVFLEWDGRKTLTEFQVDHKEAKTKEIVRTYTPDGNIAIRSFYWDDAGANLRTKTTYKYSPTGDLSEVIHQRQRFNEDITNQIDRYTYDDNGFLEKRIQTARTNQGAEQVVLLEFYTFTTQQAVAAPAEALPGGTQ